MPKFDRKRYQSRVNEITEKNSEKQSSDFGVNYLKDHKSWNASSSKEGITHIFDIIPFVAGPNWPTTDTIIKPGDETFVLNVYIHKDIGPEGEWILCPKKNYNKRCPVCEYIRTLQKSGADWDDYKGISAKRRNIYNVMPYTTEDVDENEEEGVRVFEVSDFIFGEKLAALSKNPRSGGVVPYASIDEDGKTIGFTKKLTSYGSEVSGIYFDERKDAKGPYSISQELLDQAIELSELLILLPYEKIKEMLDQQLELDGEKSDEPETPDEEELEKPVRGRRSVREVEHEEKEENPCPGGGEIGKDFEKLKPCADECPDDVYDECKKLNEEAKKSEQPERKRRRR